MRVNLCFSMQHKSRILGCSISSGSAYKKTSKTYHPFSYYVKNGADLDGSALRNSGSVMYDSEEDLAADCLPDGMCDARVGFDDMVEELGAIAAKNLDEAAKNGATGTSNSSNV